MDGQSDNFITSTDDAGGNKNIIDMYPNHDKSNKKTKSYNSVAQEILE